MRVILVKGQSYYNGLEIFIDELAVAFAEAGHDPIVFDTKGEADVAAGLARAATGQSFDLVYSINILGELRDSNSRSMGEIVGAPHVLQFVDHPLSHLARLEQTAPGTAVLTIDPSHADALKAIYGPNRFGFVGFCPHAAVGPTKSPGEDAGAFARTRPIPILFPGSYTSIGPAPWSQMQLGVQRLFEAATEIVLASEWTPGLVALDTAMRAAGLSPEDDQFAGFRKLASYVHERVRALRRVALFEAVARAELPVQVVGRGFEESSARFPNLTFLGEVSFSESIALMARSRVVLNINANFGAGSHDRTLSALNAGAAAASDFSSFYADHFEEGPEMLLYRWRDLDAGVAALGRLAGDPQAAFNMAVAGQAKVLNGHRWKNRAEIIIDAAMQARG